MTFKKMALGIALALSSSVPAYADPTNEEMMHMVKTLKDRVEQLELQLAQQARKVEEVESTAEEAVSRSGFGGVEFHGAVEVEVAGGEDHTGADGSDIALATVELGFDFSAFDDWVTGTFVALHEDDDSDPWVVDEANFTIGNTERYPVYLTAGRMYVPFGNFETNLVSDPLTLELGEAQEASVLVGFEHGGFYGSGYAFNGDMDNPGNDEIENVGWNLGFAGEGNSLEYDVGVSWINNIADTDGFTGALEDAGVTSVAEHVNGMGVHGIVRSGPFSFIGEYVTATEDFRTAELAWGAGGAQPSAYNLEVGYDFVAFGGRDSNVAFAVQGTDEAVALGLPEDKYLAAISTTLYENTSIALEYANAEDYSVADGGTGNDGDSVTLQVAVEF